MGFEFQKLDRSALVKDERDSHAWGRRVRRNQDFLAFERGIQIVDGKRQVSAIDGPGMAGMVAPLSSSDHR
jgi:hypothetical protein